MELRNETKEAHHSAERHLIAAALAILNKTYAV